MEYPNWFDVRKQYFERHLNHFGGEKDLKFLQVGAFTGDSSLWLLENVLLTRGSELYDIDTWQGSEEVAHEPFDWVDVERTYDNKLNEFKNVVKIKSNSHEALKNMKDTHKEFFDFIYIDGSHKEEDVYMDAVLSMPLLKPNGIMAFDDYDMHGTNLEVSSGVDRFFYEYSENLYVGEQTGQFWVRKKA
jgi:predicted O-methyltransferase YrrM